jgi:hypothetical protein
MKFQPGNTLSAEEIVQLEVKKGQKIAELVDSTFIDKIFSNSTLLSPNTIESFVR